MKIKYPTLSCKLSISLSTQPTDPSPPHIKSLSGASPQYTANLKEEKTYLQAKP